MNNNGKLIKVNFRRNRNNKLLQCSLTDNQKYELAIIELVYNIKPFKYDQIFNFKSGEDFIKKHKAYIDENIVIEKYLDDKSYVCDKEQNFYGVIYKEEKGGFWNNTYYIKNELLDINPKKADEIYCAVILCERKNDLSLQKILGMLGILGEEISESTYFYISRLIDKIENKIPIGEYINSLEQSIPNYYPF